MEGKVVNFFGLSVRHCCRFVLRMQFLSGAGLAKMRALVPVADRSQPVDAVPLCQSSATGKFEFPVAGKNHSQNFELYFQSSALEAGTEFTGAAVK